MRATRVSPTRFAVLSATLLSLLFLAGCSGWDTGRSKPAAQAGQEAAAPTGSGGQTQVVNEKYGYQLVVPAGWQVNTRDGQEVSATADLVLSNGDEYVAVRVGTGAHGGIVADDANNFRTLRSTKEPFTALGGEGILFRLVRSTAADTRRWAEYHFVNAKNGFTFDVSTEVPEDQETLPAYFQNILVGWQWRVPDTSLAALGAPGELNSMHMISETQGWALTKGKVLRTEDGGEHWAAVTPPGLASNTWGIGNEFYDADHAWLAVRDDDVISVVVFHTTDGGRNWGESVVPRESKGLVYGGRIDFIDSEHGWLMIEPEHGMSSRPGELYRTTDGGEHWSEMASSGGFGPTAENGLPFAGPFSFRDANSGWLSGQQGAGFAPDHHLYMTGDGGRTWQARSSLPGTGPSYFLTANNWWAWREETDTSGLAAPARGKLYRTTDGDKNWTTLAPAGDLARALEKGEKVRQLDFVTEKTGWLLLETADGRGTELLKTTDGGASWRLKTSGDGASPS